jgi:hypothetical protein
MPPQVEGLASFARRGINWCLRERRTQVSQRAAKSTRNLLPSRFFAATSSV